MFEVSPPTSPNPYLIVIGFGVPGRAVVDEARHSNLEICVIEMNPNTVKRCKNPDVKMVVGDARDPVILQQAEIIRASMVVVAIPDEESALQVTRLARHLNGAAKIITRCHFTSAGFQAKDAGADEVVVAETVVATQMVTLLAALLGKSD